MKYEERIFAVVEDNAVAISHALNQIDRNYERIEELADEVMELEYLVRRVPNPDRDAQFLALARTDRTLIEILAQRNHELELCIHGLRKFNSDAAPLLN